MAGLLDLDLPQNLGKCMVNNCQIPASVKYGDCLYCCTHWEEWVKIRRLKKCT